MKMTNKQNEQVFNFTKKTKNDLPTPDPATLPNNNTHIKT